MPYSKEHAYSSIIKFGKIVAKMFAATLLTPPDVDNAKDQFESFLDIAK